MVDELNDYRVTCSVIKVEILNRYPYARPEAKTSNIFNHILWVIEQIQLMNNQRDIDLHVGWILAKAHSLGLIDRNNDHNLEMRALIKADLANA